MGRWGARWLILAIAAASIVAAPAAVAHEGHTVFYELELRDEPSRCPTGLVYCVRVTAASPGYDPTVLDPFTGFRVTGTHNVVLNVTNAGREQHNLTLGPSPAGALSHSGLIGAGQTVRVSFRTLRDLPVGEYAYWCGVPGHQALGMHGGFTVSEAISSTAASGGDGRGANPGLGVLALVAGVALLAFGVGWHRRR